MARPKLKLTLSSFDVLMELMGGVLIILLVAYPLYRYAELPEVIPMHFDATGKPDRFGSKCSIWILPMVGFVVYVGLMILNRFPHLFNYPTEITNHNAERQYKLAATLVRTINFSTALIFYYITYQSVQSALVGQDGLGRMFLPLVILGTICPIAWYLIKVYRNG
ncbi:DUF1648 domain-containing protein [Reichenbachiella sp.]|uniref:DUF1648 domain-containing protein n=1 Tax=Reichenbachiella sp. TaxID=2184521 RepID=UPI003B594A92